MLILEISFNDPDHHRLFNKQSTWQSLQRSTSELASEYSVEKDKETTKKKILTLR